MPGYSSGAMQRGEESIHALCLHSSIAACQEDNGWMCLQWQRGIPAGQICIKWKLFFTDRLVYGIFGMLPPQDKDHKAHIKQLTLTMRMRWSDFSLLFPNWRRQNDSWVRFDSTEAFQERPPVVMTGYRDTWWTSFLPSCSLQFCKCWY